MYQRNLALGAILALFVTASLAADSKPHQYCKITVIDGLTKAGIPCATLETTNNIVYTTDDNGVVAFYEPGLMDKTVWFAVKRAGYEFPKDRFNQVGVSLPITEGGDLKISSTSSSNPPPCNPAPGLWQSGLLTIGLASPAEYYQIQVEDSSTGYALPLVLINFGKYGTYITDSGGRVAIDDPRLNGVPWQVGVSSYGYVLEGQPFGTIELTPSAGGITYLKMAPDPEQLAHRLYRVTGQGIYRDTELLGMTPPLENPNIDALVMGQDTVQTVLHRPSANDNQYVYWFWGDTAQASASVGSLRATGAFSGLPGDLGLPAPWGVDLFYFRKSPDAFAREMLPQSSVPASDPGLLGWLDGVVAVSNADGSDRIFARYMFVPDFTKVVEIGLVEFNDSTQEFGNKVPYDMSAPVLPAGHAIQVQLDGLDYFYYDNGTRIEATESALKNIPGFETFTPCRADGTTDSDVQGNLLFSWKRGVPRYTFEDGCKVNRMNEGPKEQLTDPSTGATFKTAAVSTAWNPYRHRYVQIINEDVPLADESAPFKGFAKDPGDIWYAEADTPMGPWVYARKIANHGPYFLYNVLQHPYFAEDGGRRIFFEGTFTGLLLFGTKPLLPRYEYNQLMYELDLDDAGLSFPVPVYDLQGQGVPGDFTTVTGLRPPAPGAQADTDPGPPIVFMAYDRPADGTVALYWNGAACAQQCALNGCAQRRLEAGSSPSSAPLFYALPGDTATPPPSTLPLYRYVDPVKGVNAYAVFVDGVDNGVPTGFVRDDKPLAWVWKNPLASVFPAQHYLGHLVANAGDDFCGTEGKDCHGLAVRLDGSASLDEDEAGIPNPDSTYHWSWDGGAGEADGRDVIVRFAAGLHDVTLTITDHLGNQSSDSKIVNIARSPGPCQLCTSDTDCSSNSACIIGYCDASDGACRYITLPCPPGGPGVDTPDDYAGVQTGLEMPISSGAQSSPETPASSGTPGGPDTPSASDAQSGQQTPATSGSGSSPASDPASAPSSELAGDDPPVAILENGFYDDFVDLAHFLGEETELVNINFDPAMVSDHPFLVIPSGGLYGLSASMQLASRLDQYVSAGGMLIVLAQANGYDFGAIPGDLTGEGWNGDQSCQYASVELATYHQVLSSLTRLTPDLDQDGYFTDWPIDASILLRRAKNSMPAMLLYPHGQGLVLATAQYTDWALEHSQAGGEDTALIRDILAWARLHRPLLEVSPGVTATFDLALPAVPGATEVELTTLDPGRTPIDTQLLPLGASSDGVFTVSSSVRLKNDARTGIARVDYVLRDSSHAPLTGSALARRFAISNPPAEVIQVRPLSFSVTSDATRYFVGGHGQFKIDVRNNDTAPHSVTCWSSFPHSYWNTGDSSYGAPGATSPYAANSTLHDTVQIDPGSGASIEYTRAIVASYDRLWVECLDEQGGYLGQGSKGFYGDTPQVRIDAALDREDGDYLPGEQVTTAITLTNQAGLTSSVDLVIDLLDPADHLLDSQGAHATIGAGESAAVDPAPVFTIPTGSPSGIYLLNLSAYVDGKKVGGTAQVFRLPDLEARISATFVSTGWLRGRTDFTLTSLSPLPIDDGVLDFTLRDARGPVASGSAAVTLEALETASLSVPLVLSGAEEGSWSLEYALSAGELKVSGRRSLRLGTVLAPTPDRTAYNILNDVTVQLEVTATGNFHQALAVALAVPDLAFSSDRAVTLAPGGSTTLSYTFPIPDDIPAGTYTGTATALPDGATVPVVQPFYVVIPGYRITVQPPQGSHPAGSTVAFDLTNDGGVPVQLTCYSRLTDAYNLTLVYDTQGLSVPPGSARGTFQIPDQALAGRYQLDMSCVEDATGNWAGSSSSELLVSGGPTGQLTLATDQSYYNADVQPVQATASVTGGGTIARDAYLELQVSHSGERLAAKTFRQARVGGTVRVISVDPTGDVWFGTGAGVARLSADGRTWTAYTMLDGLSSNDVTCIGFDTRGEAWVGTTYGLNRLEADGIWSNYFAGGGETRYYHGLASNNVLSVAGDPDGGVWIGTDGGLMRVEPGEDQPYTVYGPDDSPIVSAMAFDESGNRWFATDRGALEILADPDPSQSGELLDGDWLYFDAPAPEEGPIALDGPISPLAAAVAVDREGIVWFATERGASLYVDGSWLNLTRDYGLADDHVQALAIDSRGDRWFGTPAGLTRLTADGRTWTTFTTTDGLALNDIRAAGVDRAGSLWLGTDGAGAARRPAEGSSWQVVDVSNEGLADSRAKDVFIDAAGNTWFATDHGASRLAADGRTWTTWSTADGLISSHVTAVAATAAGAAWFGTDAGVSRLEPDGRTWTSYTSSSNGLIDDHIRDVAIDPDGSTWFATAAGVSRISADLKTWQRFPASPDGSPGLNDDDVRAIRIDPAGNRWFATADGLTWLHADGITWQQLRVPFTPNQDMRGIDLEPSGAVWVTLDDLIARFDPADGSWTGDTPVRWNSNDPWPTGNDDFSNPAIDQAGNIWVGSRFRGLWRRSAEDASWTSYSLGADHLASDDVEAVAADSGGHIWIATNAGVSKLELRGDGIDVFESRYLPISQLPNGLTTLSSTFGPYVPQGKYALKGTLHNAFGQKMASDARPVFYVIDQSQALFLTLEPDSPGYRPGDTATLTGEALNLSADPLQGLQLEVYQDDQRVLAEPFDLEPGEAHAFQVQVPADAPFWASARVADRWLDVQVPVSDANHDLAAYLSAPDLAGQAPFDIVANLTNNGTLDQALNVEMLELPASRQSITLHAGETRHVYFTTSIREATTFTVLVSGDATRKLTTTVQPGERVTVEALPEPAYLPGPILVPVRIDCPGQLESTLEVSWRLVGVDPQTSQADPGILDESHTTHYTLLPGASLTDSLYFDLEPGAFELSWSHPFGAGMVRFQVRPATLVSLTLEAGDYDPHSGTIPASVTVRNDGLEAFEGQLRLETDFAQLAGPVTLAGSQQSGQDDNQAVYSFAIDARGASPGMHTLTAGVYESGERLAGADLPVLVPDADFVVTALPPSGQRYQLGQQVRATFQVANLGGHGGTCTLAAQTMDALDASRSAYLEPGQAASLEFVFYIPDDLVAGAYQLNWQLGGQSGSIPYQVDGIDIAVSAALDQPWYTPGDTVGLTLTVSNRTAGALELIARATWGEVYDARKSFSLAGKSAGGDSVSVSFAIPTTSISDAKLGYAIYLSDGRSLYINGLYIRFADGGVRISADQQVYRPGDTVHLEIDTDADGVLDLTAPGYQASIEVTGQHASVSFTLASPLVSGSYAIDYAFGGVEGHYPFDVDGTQIVVDGCTLEAGTYQAGDPIRPAFQLQSNQSVAVYLVAWDIAPSGEFAQSMMSQLELSAGLQAVTATGTVATSEPGTHELRYGFYLRATNQLAETGAVYFDVAGSTSGDDDASGDDDSSMGDDDSGDDDGGDDDSSIGDDDSGDDDSGDDDSGDDDSSQGDDDSTGGDDDTGYDDTGDDDTGDDDTNNGDGGEGGCDCHAPARHPLPAGSVLPTLLLFGLACRRLVKRR